MLFAGAMIQYFTCLLYPKLLLEKGEERFAQFLDAQSVFLLQFLASACGPLLLVPPTPGVGAGVAQGGQGH